MLTASDLDAIEQRISSSLARLALTPDAALRESEQTRKNLRHTLDAVLTVLGAPKNCENPVAEARRVMKELAALRREQEETN